MSHCSSSVLRAAGWILGATLAAAGLPAHALTIIPTFESSITGGAAITGFANDNQVENAIDIAVSNVDALYGNSGTVGIVFGQSAGGFLGESTTADYSISYSNYISLLTADSAHNPMNLTLSSAVANLPSGNKPTSTGSVILSSADARVALGVFGATSCFDSGGNFVSTCAAANDGVITLSTSQALTYGATPVAGQYSAVTVLEHEINEILGGGGQGSVLNAIASGNSAFSNSVGVLDLYRFGSGGRELHDEQQCDVIFFGERRRYEHHRLQPEQQRRFRRFQHLRRYPVSLCLHRPAARLYGFVPRVPDDAGDRL